MSSPTVPPFSTSQPGPPPRPTNGLAIAGLVVGIVAFLTGLIPFGGLIIAIGAIVLSVLGLRRPFGRGPAIVGIVLGAIAGLTSLITTIVAIVGIAAGGTTPQAAAAVHVAATTPPTVAAAPPTAAVVDTPTTVTPEPTSTVAPADDDANSTDPEAAGEAYGGYPRSEARFVKIVETAADAYSATSNELKGAKIIKQRDSAACAAVGGSRVTGWVGTVHDIGANGDGKGYVEIEIAPTIVVKTWNNAFSDAGDNTLIPQSAAFFDRLSDMEEGDRVVFSGTLLPDSDSCIRTTNVTKTFAASDPDFLFRFSNVRAG